MAVNIDLYVYRNTGGARRECKAEEPKSRDAYRSYPVPDVAGLVTVEVRVDLDLERLGLRDRLLLPNEEAVEKEEEVILTLAT